LAAKDEYGKTALIMSAKRGQAEAIQALADAGAHMQANDGLLREAAAARLRGASA
jgi:ankyrin repeat protein